jgi:hypothetical protein
LGGIASGSTAPTSRQAIIVDRTAVVDPMKLPPPALEMRQRSRPLRMRDPVAYRKMKAAMASGSILPEVPSMLSLPLATTPTILTNFIGLAMVESCGTCEPPDTQVAAGPNHVVEADNVAVRIFDKTGAVLTTFGLNHLFNLDPALFTSDPKIRYDTISGRWFISMLSLDTSDPKTARNGEFDLAVSTSSDPTQPFNIYSFQTPGSLPDQPSLGFNDDKVVTGANSFSCSPDSMMAVKRAASSWCGTRPTCCRIEVCRQIFFRRRRTQPISQSCPRRAARQPRRSSWPPRSEPV